MKKFFLSVALGAFSSGVGPLQAGVVSFGTGANQFNMEFVTIGNPGNAADTTGTPNPAGAVGYTYGIGKFEVSEDMINKFNASQSLQISTDNRGLNKPATDVSWTQAARFVNWLNTSTGGSAAYKFADGNSFTHMTAWTASDTLDYDPANPFRSKRAIYVLPSTHEWYKAAYYNPTDSTYYDFANGKNVAPLSVASGTSDNTAVYSQAWGAGPADVDKAGGLSPYGVMGLSGNVSEWEEDSRFFDYDTLSFRGIRGGNWRSAANDLRSTFRDADSRAGEDSTVGFRVVTLSTGGGEVPEPTSMAIFGLGALGFAFRNRRKLLARESKKATNETMAS
jgi:sulfatase modifying factor 1